MERSARVLSIEALEHFHAALRAYQTTIHDTWEALTLEAERTVEWVEHDQAVHWRREVRQAAEVLAEAQTVLDRKQLTTNPAERPPCTEEKEIVHRAKQRLEHAEEHARAVDRWKHVVRQQTDEFRGVVAKLAHLSDTDLPKALAALDRMIVALQRYTDDQPPREPTTAWDRSSACPEVSSNSDQPPVALQRLPSPPSA